MPKCAGFREVFGKWWNDQAQQMFVCDIKGKMSLAEAIKACFCRFQQGSKGLG
jgi:hypothetical protein